MTQPQNEEIARAIYEATRIEANWSKRSIVPEKWEDRDEKFRTQFVEIIDKYLKTDKLPTPSDAHDSWMKSYFDMGWKYGEVRDVDKKTHPDLLPFDELSQDERDKDAIFLAFVWVIKEALSSQRQRVVGVGKQYEELIMAVGNKYPGETRHQTALRYIRQAEQGVQRQKKINPT